MCVSFWSWISIFYVVKHKGAQPVYVFCGLKMWCYTNQDFSSKFCSSDQNKKNKSAEGFITIHHGGCKCNVRFLLFAVRCLICHTELTNTQNTNDRQLLSDNRIIKHEKSFSLKALFLGLLMRKFIVVTRAKEGSIGPCPITDIC